MSASGLLLRDEGERILLLKPLYNDMWQLPGGLAEESESPRQAAQREALEELGLDLAVGRLLCVDYKATTTERPACIQFVFDGGRLTAEQLTNIVLPGEEIAAWQVVDPEDAPRLVRPGGPASRLVNTISALRTGETVYLEDGRRSV